MGSDGSSDSAYVGQYLGYATLLSANTGVVVREQVTYGAMGAGEANELLGTHPGENNVSMDVGVELNHNHSAMWQTVAGAGVNHERNLDADEGVSTLTAGVQTNRAFGPRGVASAGLQIEDTVGDDVDVEWTLGAGFRIFVF